MTADRKRCPASAKVKGRDLSSGTPDTDCPYADIDWCDTGWFEAYYVTAVEDGVEGPRSDIVFWDPYVSPGYARAEPQLPPFEAIAECSLEPEGPMALLSVASTASSGTELGDQLEPGAAPLLTLGQTPPEPPYSIRHLHVDHLGSTRVVTQDYSIVSTHDYFPFGEEIQPLFDYATKRFTGHERDQATGLDYMLARYYGAGLGRFLSADPLGGRPGDPQSWNRYTYVRDNPLRLVDPLGLYWAPGTPMPIIPGDPNGCTMCHDFEGGTEEEREKAYEEQEELRQSLTPETKAYFMDNFGVDIDKALRPGEGTTVNLDWEDENGGKYSRTGDPWDNDINIGAEPGSDQFRELLLHESGHWAADMASWFGSVEPELDDATRAHIDRIIGRYPAIQFRMAFEGYAGYGAEWSQFGNLPTLIP